MMADKFTPALDVWNPFIENCIKCYKSRQNTTTNEQLSTENSNRKQ